MRGVCLVATLSGLISNSYFKTMDRGSRIFLLVAVCYMVMFTIDMVQCKVYERCELARDLRKHKIPKSDLGKWLCIAEFESNFNTAAKNEYNYDDSKDYGLFQINNRYWCEAPGSANACKMSCERLLDDNIADDVQCALYIKKVHGLHAWVVWNNRCLGRDLNYYLYGCGI